MLPCMVTVIAIAAIWSAEQAAAAFSLTAREVLSHLVIIERDISEDSLRQIEKTLV